MDKEELKKIVNENPNNITLGNKIRHLYDGVFTVDINGTEKTIDMNKDYPNDMSLGEAVRKMIITNE